MYWLAIVAVLYVAIALYYYFRMYGDDVHARAQRPGGSDSFARRAHRPGPDRRRDTADRRLSRAGDPTGQRCDPVEVAHAPRFLYNR